MRKRATGHGRVWSRHVSTALLALALLTAACTPATPTSEPLPEATVTSIGGGETTTTSTLPPTTSSSPPETAAVETEPPAANPGRVSAATGNFIPLDDPVMVAASSATWLNLDDVVLGIVTPNGTAQAFPIRQMAYHHIANTTIEGEPYLVTY
ncbi:MAG: DUF3179 domain-containing protein [Acidimicrobiia bacterium]|nr:DUF3179 domain-containing protein [Acidimicrobiia bacterium]